MNNTDKLSLIGGIAAVSSYLSVNGFYPLVTGAIASFCFGSMGVLSQGTRVNGRQ